MLESGLLLITAFAMASVRSMPTPDPDNLLSPFFNHNSNQNGVWSGVASPTTVSSATTGSGVGEVVTLANGTTITIVNTPLGWQSVQGTTNVAATTNTGGWNNGNGQGQPFLLRSLMTTPGALLSAGQQTTASTIGTANVGNLGTNVVNTATGNTVVPNLVSSIPFTQNFGGWQNGQGNQNNQGTTVSSATTTNTGFNGNGQHNGVPFELQRLLAAQNGGQTATSGANVGVTVNGNVPNFAPAIPMSSFTWDGQQGTTTTGTNGNNGNNGRRDGSFLLRHLNAQPTSTTTATTTTTTTTGTSSTSTGTVA